MKLQKRNFLIAIVTILSVIHSYNTNAQTKSQDSIVGAQFEKDINTFSIKVNELEKTNKKDYIALSKLYNNIIDKYENLPTLLQKKYNYVKELYYSSACYNTRLGKKKEALTDFDKAADYGVQDYSLAKKDSALIPLHKYERFKKALARLAEKTDYEGMLKASQAYTADKKEYQFHYGLTRQSPWQGLTKTPTIFKRIVV